MNNYDIAIVGNGILAYSTAFELLHKEPKLNLAIIGPRQRLYAASTAAGAMLGCFGEVTEKTLSSSFHKTKFDLSVEAITRWPEWIEKINISDKSVAPVAPQQGTFVIHNTTSGELDDINFKAIIQALQLYQQPYNKVNPRDIPGYNPNLHSRSTDCLYIPNEGFVSPHALLKKLELGLEQLATVTYIDAKVDKILSQSGNATGVKLMDGQTIHADKVLLAAGSATQSIVDKTSLKDTIPRLFYGVGSALLLERKNSAIKHVIRTANRSFACGLHALPRDNGLYIGATNNVAVTPERNPRLGLVNFLSQCAIDQIDRQLNQAKVVGFEVGCRPISIDTFPLIGQTSIEGLFVLSGTYRDGLHCAPVFADIMSDELLGREPTITHPFQPMRTPINLYTKQQAIDEGVQHYLSGAYEHKMTLPNVGWYDMFKDMLVSKITKVYDELDTDFIIPPDFLLLFDEASPEDIQFFHDYLRRIAVSNKQKVLAEVS